jgi:hypothetical protein
MAEQIAKKREARKLQPSEIQENLHPKPGLEGPSVPKPISSVDTATRCTPTVSRPTVIQATPHFCSSPPPVSAKQILIDLSNAVRSMGAADRSSPADRFAALRACSGPPRSPSAHLPPGADAPQSPGLGEAVFFPDRPPAIALERCRCTRTAAAAAAAARMAAAAGSPLTAEGGVDKSPATTPRDLGMSPITTRPAPAGARPRRGTMSGGGGAGSR